MTGEGWRRTETRLPYQHRHTARSRSIHGGVQRALASLADALAGGDGFRDCARNDEVWVRRVLRGMTGFGGGGCCGGWRGLGAGGWGLASATALGMTTAVILREVAVSMVECKGRWIFWLMRWQAEMDSATARGMTKFGCGGYFGNDGRRVAEDRDALALPTPSYCAKSQYP